MKFKRAISADLLKWKAKAKRKPLVLKGARQVGKTFLLKALGSSAFQDTAYFNFEEQPNLKQFFENTKDVKRILKNLSLVYGKEINPKKTLIIFDEIQECNAALNSLKYFCENLPELALISAGSLLGVTLSEESFPVGKVEYASLYPMTFRELLLAHENQMLLQAYDEASENKPVLLMAHQKLWEELLNYYIIGGMPSAVQAYLHKKEDRMIAFQELRQIQKELVEDYNKDFAKHSGKENSVHIISVFENVPLQMAAVMEDSTKRFRFNDVIPKKKGYAELRGPIDWLKQAGLIYKIKISSSKRKRRSPTPFVMLTGRRPRPFFKGRGF